MQISELIDQQKGFLIDQLGEGLMKLAKTCDECLEGVPNIEQLNKVLHAYIGHHQHANLVYVINSFGIQLSANITRQGIDNKYQGQDLSDRPFF